MLYAPGHFRYFAICIIFLAVSCTNRSSGEDKNLITNPNAMNEEVADQLKETIDKAAANAGKIDDSTRIALYQIVEQFYKKGDYKPVWSNA